MQDIVMKEDANIGIERTRVALGVLRVFWGQGRCGVSGPSGANSSAYVSDSTIVRNVTGLNAVSSGTIVSGGDNRLAANTFNGGFTSTVLKL